MLHTSAIFLIISFLYSLILFIAENRTLNIILLCNLSHKFVLSKFLILILGISFPTFQKSKRQASEQLTDSRLCLFSYLALWVISPVSYHCKYHFCAPVVDAFLACTFVLFAVLLPFR